MRYLDDDPSIIMDLPDTETGLPQFLLEFSFTFGVTPKTIQHAEQLFVSGMGEDLLYRAYLVANKYKIRYPTHISISPASGEISVHCICGHDYYECDCSAFQLPLIDTVEHYIDFWHAYHNLPSTQPLGSHFHPFGHRRNGTPISFGLISLNDVVVIFDVISIISFGHLVSIRIRFREDSSLRRVAWNCSPC